MSDCVCVPACVYGSVCLCVCDCVLMEMCLQATRFSFPVFFPVLAFALCKLCRHSRVLICKICRHRSRHCCCNCRLCLAHFRLAICNLSCHLLHACLNNRLVAASQLVAHLSSVALNIYDSCSRGRRPGGSKGATRGQHAGSVDSLMATFNNYELQFFLTACAACAPHAVQRTHLQHA